MPQELQLSRHMAWSTIRAHARPCCTVQCAATASSKQPKHSCKDKKNRVVSRGLQLPLEVFKTENGRGWGVRCSCDIPIGTFVCDYVGRLLTDTEAVSLMEFASHIVYDVMHVCVYKTFTLKLPTESGCACTMFL